MGSACYFYHLAALFQVKKKVKSLFSPFQAATAEEAESFIIYAGAQRRGELHQNLCIRDQ